MTCSPQFVTLPAQHSPLGTIFLSYAREDADAALDCREEALSALREILRGPCWWSPNEIRFDPFLSRLKDDPRFEEILKAAKPL